jgi:hypothetical protein
MDCLVNLALRGHDSRLVLHRGFAEGVVWKENEGMEELYEDDVENHSNVHKLSRLIEESPARSFSIPKAAIKKHIKVSESYGN